MSRRPGIRCGGSFLLISGAGSMPGSWMELAADVARACRRSAGARYAALQQCEAQDTTGGANARHLSCEALVGKLYIMLIICDIRGAGPTAAAALARNREFGQIGAPRQSGLGRGFPVTARRRSATSPAIASSTDNMTITHCERVGTLLLSAARRHRRPAATPMHVGTLMVFASVVTVPQRPAPCRSGGRSARS